MTKKISEINEYNTKPKIMATPEILEDIRKKNLDLAARIDQTLKEVYKELDAK